MLSNYVSLRDAHYDFSHKNYVWFVRGCVRACVRACDDALCHAYLMLSVSLDCPFLIDPLVLFIIDSLLLLLSVMLFLLGTIFYVCF